MYKVTPETQSDGTETVTLYGTVVDVTKLKEFDLFKKHYTVVRPKADKPKKQKQNTKGDES